MQRVVAVFRIVLKKNSEGTFKQVNEKTNVKRDVRRERVEDGMWGVDCQRINSLCYKY